MQGPNYFSHEVSRMDGKNGLTNRLKFRGVFVNSYFMSEGSSPKNTSPV